MRSDVSAPFGALLLALLTLSAVSACVDKVPDQDLRVIAAVPVGRMSADILWKEFHADAAQAKRTYWGKVVEITGTSTKIGTDAPGDRYVMFGQAGEQGVRANLLDDQARDILANIPASHRLTLKCFCDGLSGDVVLKSCVKP